MKTARFFLTGLTCMVVSLPLFSQSTLERAESLRSIVKTAESDSIQYIERTAAYLFHQKINAYRISKKSPALQWDDTLWLAAKNHNLWMSENDDLEHSENKGTPAYSGASPGDRYQYVTSYKGKTQWSGENVLYNYSAYGQTANEIAERIAQYSIEQWQGSPGHNDNMLNADSYLHGVAFKIDGGKVWSTDLFARKPYDAGYRNMAFNAPASTTFSNHGTIASNNTFTNAPAGNETVAAPKKQTTSQFEKSIRTSLSGRIFGEDVVTEKALLSAAKSHLAYMALHKTTTSEEKKGKSRFTGTTPMKRVKKAARLKEFFKKMRSNVFEYVFTKTYSADDFTAEDAVIDATNKFSAERKGIAGELKTTGIAVQVRKLKTSYTVYIVALERRSKGKKAEVEPETTDED